MARPKKTEPRDRQFNISLTVAEFESLVQRAQNVGMRPVHFGRDLLLDQAHKSSVKQESSENNLQKMVYSQLARMGNNLNQLLRHLHRTGDPLPADLEPLLADIRQIIGRVQR